MQGKGCTSCAPLLCRRNLETRYTPLFSPYTKRRRKNGKTQCSVLLAHARLASHSTSHKNRQKRFEKKRKKKPYLFLSCTSPGVALVATSSSSTPFMLYALFVLSLSCKNLQVVISSSSAAAVLFTRCFFSRASSARASLSLRLCLTFAFPLVPLSSSLLFASGAHDARELLLKVFSLPSLLCCFTLLYVVFPRLGFSLQLSSFFFFFSSIRKMWSTW